MSPNRNVSAHSPENIEPDVVDLLAEVVRLEVELVCLGGLLDARAADELSPQVAPPLVVDGDVAVPEILGVDGEREPNHDHDEGDPQSCIIDIQI